MTLYDRIRSVLAAEVTVVPFGVVPAGPIAMLRTGGIVEQRRVVEIILAVPYTTFDPESDLAEYTDTVYELLRPHLVDLVAARTPDYAVAGRGQPKPGYPSMLLSGSGRNAGLGNQS